MLLSIIILILGFILLVWSADEFTDNGARVAKILNLSPLLIGVLIFGFGTSAPEILVSSLAAIDGNVNLSIGNALGSNIINIALVLGISVIITPIAVSRGLFREWSLLMIATLTATVVLMDGSISRLDGIILLTTLAIILVIITKTSKNNASLEQDEIEITQKSYIIWLRLLFGLAILVTSAEMVVYSGSKLASAFGVSQTVIGLTLVAFGTSLPELAVSIMAAMKKQHETIIGNIIGSNLFNTLAVIAMPGLIYPSVIDSSLVTRDMPFVIVLTVTLLVLAYKFNKPLKIERWGGVVLVLMAVYYLSILF